TILQPNRFDGVLRLAVLAHRKMFLATARMETSDKKRPPHPPPKGLAFCFAESSGFWSPALARRNGFRRL
ncbi:hypothetical protein, partial [Acidaminococcus intestini]|uniref:hypothetical protein n=1 Tax=Acidaminococcus intestini TaxID=187327 RepID=UPI00307953C3